MPSRKQDRRYYLTDVPLDEAKSKFFNRLQLSNIFTSKSSETIPLRTARDRVTAGPVWAKISSPHYDSSAMDGAAVRSADTIGATETNPVQLTLGEKALWRNTGDPCL